MTCDVGRAAFHLRFALSRHRMAVGAVVPSNGRPSFAPPAQPTPVRALEALAFVGTLRMRVVRRGPRRADPKRAFPRHRTRVGAFPGGPLMPAFRAALARVLFRSAGAGRWTFAEFTEEFDRAVDEVR